MAADAQAISLGIALALGGGKDAQEALRKLSSE